MADIAILMKVLLLPKRKNTNDTKRFDSREKYRDSCKKIKQQEK